MAEPELERGGWRRWRLLLAGTWAVLLLASHTWWAFHRSAEEVPTVSGTETLEVRTVEDGERVSDSSRGVRFAYSDGGPAGRDRPVLVLLHGSPGSVQDFDSLAGDLRESHRVIVPDLPGFGDSQRDVPDYSAFAHSMYLEALLERLEVERAHLVGFSMGGAVAMELADRRPHLVASITLVGSLGVVELELFGDQRLNHLVHGMQLAVIQGLRYGFPHFGSADHWMLGLPYARSFYDTDQRRLRGCFERYAGPMRIVHGRTDFLVPLPAAEEHHRLVPQSELEVLEASHFLLWTHPEEVAALIGGFVDSVERGEARRRDTATERRLAAAREPFDPSGIPPASGPALWILVLVIILATFISEDLTCIAAGLMVAEGRIEFLPALLACGAGIFIGDVGIFLGGRILGRPVVRRAPLRWILSPASLTRASDWFRRKGVKAVFLSRFMPGIRLPTYFAAGVLKTSLLSFSFYFGIAIIIWTPFLLGFAAWAGSEALEIFERWGALALIGVLLALLMIERVLLRVFTFRGRRSLVGAWRRWTRWEFWPMWIFYPPVIAYVAWLAFRYRSFTLVTAVNPAIPGGGFVGESKSEILRHFGDDHELVARHRLLPIERSVEERLEIVRTFAAELESPFPLILKPDVGQRGSGVRMVRDERELEDRLRVAEVDWIVQEFVEGPEYGVFYVREPGAARGRIFSITEKHLPEVIGDGKHTLEELVLLDERAVTIAPTYLRVHPDRLQEVPAEGVVVRLVDVGTHCRGAIFTDGAHLETPELEERIESLSREVAGFHFGRYDLRAASEAALCEGRDVKVLELHGLTSAATPISGSCFQYSSSLTSAGLPRPAPRLSSAISQTSSGRSRRTRKLVLG